MMFTMNQHAVEGLQPARQLHHFQLVFAPSAVFLGDIPLTNTEIARGS
jgi:hypothetical protein